MYLVDVGVLVRAAVATVEDHRAAVGWLDERLAGRARTVGLAWPVLFGFIDRVTDGSVVDPPATVGQAWDQVQRWIDAPAAWTPVPGAQHPHLVTELLTAMAAGRNGHQATAGDETPASDQAGAVTGGVSWSWVVHVAALAMEHGLTVATTNPAVGRLGVRWFNPLVPDMVGGRR